MSETDSFIEEVTEEVRRDRLFRLFRKYGWIAVAAVVLLVGGAAWNEYTKAKARAEAEAKGDAILAALDADDSTARQAALAAIADAGGAAPIVAMLEAAEAEAAGDTAAAAAALGAIAADSAQPPLYRDLATLKRAMLTAADTDPAERIAALEPLTAPGAPFRVLAEEQIALAEIESGARGAALERLRALSQDTEASQGLRLRVARLIVALGGDEDPA